MTEKVITSQSIS